MNWQALMRILAALVITIIVCGFMWLILGLIGYNRIGWFGVEVAAFPPIVLGIILFFVLNKIFKEIYPEKPQNSDVSPHS